MRKRTHSTAVLPPGVKERRVIRTGRESSSGDTRIARFAIGKDGTLHLACRQAGVASCSPESNSWRWLPPTKGDVIRVSISPDGRYLGVGGYPNSLEIRHTETLDLVASIRESQSEINSIEWSPDGRFVAAGSMELVLLMDGSTGAVLSRLNTPCYSMAWSTDGQFLTVGGDGRIKLLDQSLSLCYEFRCSSGEPVSGLRYVPGRMTFFSISKDGTLMGWRRPRTSPWLTTLAHKAGAIALAVSADLVVTKGRDDSVKVFCAESGRLLATIFDRSTNSGWAIGMEWIVPGQVLAFPSDRESILRVVELDRQRLKFGRLGFLCDRQNLARVRRPIRPEEPKSLESVSLVSPLFEGEARRIAPELHSYSGSRSLALLKPWVRCRSHGLPVPHLDDLLGSDQPLGNAVDRLLARLELPMRRTIGVLLADGRGQEVSSALVTQLQSLETRHPCIQLIGALAEPQEARQLIEALLTMAAYGDESEGKAAGSAFEYGVASHTRCEITERIEEAVLNCDLPDTSTTTALRVLRRAPSLHLPILASAIIARSRKASDALKVELFDTLCAMAPTPGMISLESLLCLIDEHRVGWEPLVLALSRHHEFRSAKVVKRALTSWQQGGDPHFETLSGWLARRLQRDDDAARNGEKGNLNRALADEDVLDANFLRQLQRTGTADVPERLAQRVLRLLWLPLMPQSPVPLLARRLFKKWTAAGRSFVVGFSAAEDLSPETASQAMTILSTPCFRHFVMGLIGRDQDTWLRRINTEVERFFDAAAKDEFYFASRLLLDLKRLRGDLSPVEDMIHAVACLRSGRASSAYLRRALDHHLHCDGVNERSLLIVFSATLPQEGGQSFEHPDEQ